MEFITKQDCENLYKKYREILNKVGKIATEICQIPIIQEHIPKNIYCVSYSLIEIEILVDINKNIFQKQIKEICKKYKNIILKGHFNIVDYTEGQIVFQLKEESFLWQC